MVQVLCLLLLIYPSNIMFIGLIGGVVDPSFQSDLRPQQPQVFSSATATPAVQKPSKFQRIVGLFRKYWYIAAAVLVTIAGLVAWNIYQTNQANTWKQATDAFTRADYDSAAKLIQDKAIPTDADHLRVYSQTMLATRHLDKALAGYQRLYEQKKDPSVQLVIGNIYNEQKKYDQALKIYREAITANPGNVQAYVNMATVYKLQNDTSNAIKIANQGVKSNPASATLHELQVSMLMDDTKSDAYRAAIDDLKKLNPNDPLLQALHE